MAFNLISNRVINAEPLSLAEAQALLAHSNLAELGLLAQTVRERLNPELIATYAIGASVPVQEQDNPSAAAAFAAAAAAGAGEVTLFVSGESIPSLDHWEAILREGKVACLSKKTAGSISTEDVARFEETGSLEAGAILARLQKSGLDSLRGESVGAPASLSSRQWLRIHRAAHSLGLPTTAAIPESLQGPAEIVEHLQAIRDLQDETGLFQSFVSGWRAPRTTPDLPALARPAHPAALSSFAYLRLLAVSRCFLHNIKHVQGAWESQGTKIGQVALRSGADDFGSSGMLRKTSDSRYIPVLAVQEIERLIRDSGFAPWPRDWQYQRLPQESVARRSLEGMSLPVISR